MMDLATRIEKKHGLSTGLEAELTNRLFKPWIVKVNDPLLRF
jgi:hypothetical protein